MRIAMPSPNGTNKARLFVGPRFAARAAYDAKHGLRGLARDDEVETPEMDSIQEGLSKLSAMAQRSMPTASFKEFFALINEMKDAYLQKLGEHAAELNQQHAAAEGDEDGSAGRGNAYPPPVGGTTLAKDGRPSILRVKANEGNASHKRLKAHLNRIGTV